MSQAAKKEISAILDSTFELTRDRVDEIADRIMNAMARPTRQGASLDDLLRDIGSAPDTERLQMAACRIAFVLEIHGGDIPDFPSRQSARSRVKKDRF